MRERILAISHVFLSMYDSTRAEAFRDQRNSRAHFLKSQKIFHYIGCSGEN